MVWHIELDPSAEKELDKMDKPVAGRILKFLNERIAHSEDPRSFGESLKGRFEEYWKYRVGDYRIVCSILNDIVTVMVVKIAHRRHVYK